MAIIFPLYPELHVTLNFYHTHCCSFLLLSCTKHLLINKFVTVEVQPIVIQSSSPVYLIPKSSINSFCSFSTCNRDSWWILYLQSIYTLVKYTIKNLAPLHSNSQRSHTLVNAYRKPFTDTNYTTQNWLQLPWILSISLFFLGAQI